MIKSIFESIRKHWKLVLYTSYFVTGISIIIICFFSIRVLPTNIEQVGIVKNNSNWDIANISIDNSSLLNAFTNHKKDGENNG